MKKVWTAALCAACLTTGLLGVSAEGKDPQTSDVKVNVAGAETVYKIDVEWGNLTFNYNGSTWDTSTHQYTGGNWESDTTTVTLTNHSNAAVNYTAAFDESDSVTANGVTATLTGRTGELATAEGTAVEEAPEGTFNVSVNGTPTAGSFTVGTITITLE